MGGMEMVGKKGRYEKIEIKSRYVIGQK